MRILTIIFIMITSVASANEKILTIPGVDYWGITQLDSYGTGLPQTASSYDGVERDISRFYTADQDNFVFGAVFGVDNTQVSFTATSGYRADKIAIDPSLNLSVTQVLLDNDGFSLTADVGGVITSAVKHTSCNDIFERQYYCGNLTAWSDFDSKETQAEAMITNVNVTATWSF